MRDAGDGANVTRFKGHFCHFPNCYFYAKLPLVLSDVKLAERYFKIWVSSRWQSISKSTFRNHEWLELEHLDLKPDRLWILSSSLHRSAARLFSSRNVVKWKRHKDTYTTQWLWWPWPQSPPEPHTLARLLHRPTVSRRSDSGINSTASVQCGFVFSVHTLACTCARVSLF